MHKSFLIFVAVASCTTESATAQTQTPLVSTLAPRTLEPSLPQRGILEAGDQLRIRRPNTYRSMKRFQRLHVPDRDSGPMLTVGIEHGRPFLGGGFSLRF